MAYSNTNKDNVQAKSKRPFLSVLAVIMAIIFILSSINSVWKQITLLNKAEVDLAEIEDKIDKTKLENLRLVEEIKEATTSMGMKRNMAKYFGLGTENEYWLKIPKNDQTGGANVKINDEIGMENENWAKWWKLFFK